MTRPSRPWAAHVLTLFPELFPGPLDASILGRARAAGLWDLNAVDLRDFALDRHRTVDDTPFGGGPGMVLKAEVVDRAVRMTPPGHRLIYLSPRGRLMTQSLVADLAAAPGVTLLCGRYEGVDQRVLDAHDIEEVSIGDYVLAGGELAAMVLIEAVVRLIPGVLGNAETPVEESFADGLLEYPHYTRPQDWRDEAGVVRSVPAVLLTGNHQEIARWRSRASQAVTRARRPDLLQRYLLQARQGAPKHRRRTAL